jgi:hypothetical protein
MSSLELELGELNIASTRQVTSSTSVIKLSLSRLILIHNFNPVLSFHSSLSRLEQRLLQGNSYHDLKTSASMSLFIPQEPTASTPYVPIRGDTF